MDGLETEAYDRKYSDRELLSRIGAYFRPFRRPLIGVGVILVAASASEFLVRWLVARSIDWVIASPGAATFALVSLAIIALGSLNWLFNFLRQYLQGRAVANTIFKLRSDAFSKAIAHDMSFFDEFSTGKVVSRVTTDTEDFANIIGNVVDFVSQCFLVVVYFGYLLWLNWTLALVVLAMAPVAAGVALAFRKLARFVTSNAKRVTAEVNSQIQETIAGIAVAKNFRQERSLWQAFKANNGLSYRFHLRRGLVLNLIFPLVSLLSAFGDGTVAMLGGVAVRDLVISAGGLFLFMSAVGYFWWPMLSIASFWSQFQDGLAAAERVFSLIDREPRVRQKASRKPDAVAGAVSYRDTVFSYSSKETVLDGFSLDIAAGEKVAIVGKTGAGKSSIIKLLCRFYEFQGGSISVDGLDVREWDLDALRLSVGLVSQDPFLFPGTVADNVRFARPEASDAEVEAAARHLGRGDWVDDLPGGLATETGHRGSALSMGQRQLVALARVVLKRPSIFILDEATSSVDPFTEAQIQEGLESVMEGRTAIVIAHRLSTVRFADRIIVLEAGRILEEGRHDELLARGGHYADLYNTYFRHQSLEYIETGAGVSE
jgi:ABC-type multidrug transport system fused ATPase/permease subunit